MVSFRATVSIWGDRINSGRPYQFGAMLSFGATVSIRGDRINSGQPYQFGATVSIWGNHINLGRCYHLGHPYHFGRPQGSPLRWFIVIIFVNLRARWNNRMGRPLGSPYLLVVPHHFRRRYRFGRCRGDPCGRPNSWLSRIVIGDRIIFAACFNSGDHKGRPNDGLSLSFSSICAPVGTIVWADRWGRPIYWLSRIIFAVGTVSGDGRGDPCGRP